jgi:hypothetical protein
MRRKRTAGNWDETVAGNWRIGEVRTAVKEGFALRKKAVVGRKTD